MTKTFNLKKEQAALLVLLIGKGYSFGESIDKQINGFGSILLPEDSKKEFILTIADKEEMQSLIRTIGFSIEKIKEKEEDLNDLMLFFVNSEFVDAAEVIEEGETLILNHEEMKALCLLNKEIGLSDLISFVVDQFDNESSEETIIEDIRTDDASFVLSSISCAKRNPKFNDLHAELDALMDKFQPICGQLQQPEKD
jgi:hypothetical protein